MSKIVKIIDPQKVVDVVYYKHVSVEYDGIKYTFMSAESDNGTDYSCAINNGRMVEMDQNFDNQVATDICEKIFQAYSTGYVNQDEICEIDLDEIE